MENLIFITQLRTKKKSLKPFLPTLKYSEALIEVLCDTWADKNFRHDIKSLNYSKINISVQKW